MTESTAHNLQPGQSMQFANRLSTALRITITALTDSTKVEFLLTPGAEARLTAGTGSVRVDIDNADQGFAGLELVRDQPDT